MLQNHCKFRRVSSKGKKCRGKHTFWHKLFDREQQQQQQPKKKNNNNQKKKTQPQPQPQRQRQQQQQQEEEEEQNREEQNKFHDPAWILRVFSKSTSSASSGMGAGVKVPFPCQLSCKSYHARTEQQSSNLWERIFTKKRSFNQSVAHFNEIDRRQRDLIRKKMQKSAKGCNALPRPELSAAAWHQWQLVFLPRPQWMASPWISVGF